VKADGEDAACCDTGDPAQPATKALPGGPPNAANSLAEDPIGTFRIRELADFDLCSAPYPLVIASAAPERDDLRGRFVRGCG